MSFKLNNFAQEIKMQREKEEKLLLSSTACFSYDTKGRAIKESLDGEVRSPFMRDRDRIIHSASFRRLKDKTQVFFSSKNDMVRTRLAHTLEVSQISRTIANVLRLNETLTEAIALGHDLGHTPFGHAGERAISALCSEWFKEGKKLIDTNFLEDQNWLSYLFTSFRHNVQSLRVVDFLEKNGTGLNLTYEVRDGILNHSKWGKDLIGTQEKFLPITQEGRIVRIADRLAYVNHDLQDSLRLGMINKQEIPQEIIKVLGETHTQRINTCVLGVIVHSRKQNEVTIAPDVAKAIQELYTFLNERVYKDKQIMAESQKAQFVIKELAYFYKSHPEVVHKATQDINYPKKTTIEQRIIDYIANMTDRYIISEFRHYLLPLSKRKYKKF
jgi:dGTPase